EFIAFSLRPEQQKIFSDNIAYGPTHKGAVKLMDPARLPLMPTTPENIANQVAIDVTFWADYGEQLEQRFNAWAARGAGVLAHDRARTLIKRSDLWPLRRCHSGPGCRSSAAWPAPNG